MAQIISLTVTSSMLLTANCLSGSQLPLMGVCYSISIYKSIYVICLCTCKRPRRRVAALLSPATSRMWTSVHSPRVAVIVASTSSPAPLRRALYYQSAFDHRHNRDDDGVGGWVIQTKLGW